MKQVAVAGYMSGYELRRYHCAGNPHMSSGYACGVRGD
jgi:hypothetical protein